MDAWRDAIRDTDGTERVENMICSSPSAHAMHIKGFFALELIYRDSEGKWMTVRFWWLECFGNTDDFAHATVPQLPLDFNPCDNNRGPHYIETGCPLRSGDVIMLKTHNPNTHPLPDTRLLELQ